MRISDWSSDVCSSDLASADVIAAEDTRVTAKLLSHLGLRVPMTPYHDHSDERTRAALVARMEAEIVVLVSDAGTPLISDPGYKLVRDARAAGRPIRSEARRVGKECVSTCRSRWSPYH